MGTKSAAAHQIGGHLHVISRAQTAVRTGLAR
jgi:hypothetical protein